MATKRMFHKEIVRQDAFLEMPVSARELYFQLNMEADDDGFVSNPKSIMRTVKASEDDYKILFAKRYILVFPSGICVIKHWRIHNYIQGDRYQETKYLEEKSELSIKENKSYTEKKNEVTRFKPKELETVIDVPDWIDKEVWMRFVKYRKEKKQTMTPTTVRMLLKKLEKNKENHVEMLEQSMEQGWTGVFEIKGRNKKAVRDL